MKRSHRKICPYELLYCTHTQTHVHTHIECTTHTHTQSHLHTCIHTHTHLNTCAHTNTKSTMRTHTHRHSHTHTQLCNCYLVVEHQQHCALHILIPWTLHLKSICLLSGGCPVPLHTHQQEVKHNTQHSQCTLNMFISTQRSAFTMHTEHVHLHTMLSIHNDTKRQYS